MSTPHNAARPGEVAKVVLMPGDPLRARHVAETYLEDCACFNKVRGMLGFTGTYQGVPISVMGSGMGAPSMGIYSHELYRIYGVETIVRIGSAGGLSPDIRLRDVVVAQAVCTDSNYAHQFGMPGTIAPIGDFDLLRRAVEEGAHRGVRVRVGNVLSSDVFYSTDEAHRLWAQMGCLAVEMETVALYLNAMRAHKRALALYTISDLPLVGESLSATERQTSFSEMMEIALVVALFAAQ